MQDTLHKVLEIVNDRFRHLVSVSELEQVKTDIRAAFEGNSSLTEENPIDDAIRRHRIGQSRRANEGTDQSGHDHGPAGTEWP